jgi:endonuclease/exonuclease/phosphatase family metal-dependent hydrolase
MTDIPPAKDHSAPALHAIWPRLAQILSRLLQWPAAAFLRPSAARVRAVAQPGGPIVLQEQPRRVPRAPTKMLTVLSANLWHDWPQHRGQRDRLEQFAHLVERENVDVALLQEVSRHSNLHADEWLAQRLGMAYAYARANGDRKAIGFEEGVAVFSRFPLTDAALHHLGSGQTPFARRLALATSLETPFGALDVFSVHLGLLPWQNAAQVQQLLSWVGARTGQTMPAIVGGDFNAHEDTRQVTRVREAWLDLFRCHHPQKDGATHEIRFPLGAGAWRRRLDYLFLARNGHCWRVLDAAHLDATGGRHSDHRAVLARLSPCPQIF